VIIDLSHDLILLFILGDKKAQLSAFKLYQFDYK